MKSNKYTSPMDIKAAMPQYLGIESLSDLPLEVKNPNSLSNLTPWADLVISGTISNVAHMERINKPLVSLKYCDIPIPRVMPSQNIIFQKLSLLSRALIQFIGNSIFKIYNGILLLLNLLLKRINNIGILITLILISSVTNAADLKALINDIEQQYAIPQGLLHSIAKVESSVNPYAINVEGKAIFPVSKSEALETIKYYRSLGHTNIDIGVMQINYRWHGKEFANIGEMLDVSNNVEYAAKLLTNLHKEHGSWHKATRLYHSATPKYHKQYSKKIIIAWLRG